MLKDEETEKPLNIAMLGDAIILSTKNVVRTWLCGFCMILLSDR